MNECGVRIKFQSSEPKTRESHSEFTVVNATLFSYTGAKPDYYLCLLFKTQHLGK